MANPLINATVMPTNKTSAISGVFPVLNILIIHIFNIYRKFFANKFEQYFC